MLMQQQQQQQHQQSPYSSARYGINNQQQQQQQNMIGLMRSPMVQNSPSRQYQQSQNDVSKKSYY